MTTSIPVTFPLLTESKLDGSGIYDILMRANMAHLEQEFQKNRIRGPEYATVYLGGMNAVLQASVQFLLAKEKATQEAQLLEEQIKNAILEGKVLIAQECKLRAEYDLTVQNTAKALEETLLLAQKTVTEKAQTQSSGTDADSVIGKQKALYQAQTDGFQRDAEQKAAKVMVDSWNVRRTTNEETLADGNNKLNDASIGRVVERLISGVGA